MEGTISDIFIADNGVEDEKQKTERRSITRHRNDDDEGATWSVSSNGGISQSSHDDGFVFQSEYLMKSDQLSKLLSIVTDVSTHSEDQSDELSE